MARRVVPIMAILLAALLFYGVAELVPRDEFRASLAFESAAIDGPPVGIRLVHVACLSPAPRSAAAFLPPRKWRRNPVAWTIADPADQQVWAECSSDDLRDQTPGLQSASVAAVPDPPGTGDRRRSTASAGPGGQILSRLVGCLRVSRPPPA